MSKDDEEDWYEGGDDILSRLYSWTSGLVRRRSTSCGTPYKFHLPSTNKKTLHFTMSGVKISNSGHDIPVRFPRTSFVPPASPDERDDWHRPEHLSNCVPDNERRKGGAFRLCLLILFIRRAKVRRCSR